jgi:hypothetical protein
MAIKTTLTNLLELSKKSSSNLTGAAVNVANKVGKSSEMALSSTSNAVMDVANMLKKNCSPSNLVPCLTIVTLIVYIVIVNPSTVLEVFSSPVGKLFSMSVVLVALIFDIRLGVMLGLAVVLSISFAGVNRDLYESYTHDTDLDDMHLSREMHHANTSEEYNTPHTTEIIQSPMDMSMHSSEPDDDVVPTSEGMDDSSENVMSISGYDKNDIIGSPYTVAE